MHPVTHVQPLLRRLHALLPQPRTPFNWQHLQSALSKLSARGQMLWSAYQNQIEANLI